MYKYFIRPLFFFFPPETIHRMVFFFLKVLRFIPGAYAVLRRVFVVRDPRLKREVFGLVFDNPVGLAAGFDKDGELPEELSALGFGFIEIGTVTPKPQPGNQKPRMFRLPEDEGLINRMGFNNEGAEAVSDRLKKRKGRTLLGINIGKNKNTPNEDAGGDYAVCFESLFEVADYFVVNVSSPNTPGLRELQEKEPLKKLLLQLKQLNKKLASEKRMSERPILLKIAPDLSNAQLNDIIEIVESTAIQGVVATNTTLSREGLKTPVAYVHQAGAGGLSGKPVRARSTEVIRYLRERSGGAFPIIGVGGIHSVDDAMEKINAGASLVQLYTGFIYEGPGLVKKINKALLSL